MKILIIRNYPSYMDVEHNTYNIQEIGLAKALVRKGHTCDIVFWTNNKEKTVDYTFEDKHIKVYYKRGINILKNAVYININKLIKQYDVIQLCEYNQLQSWLMAKKYPDKTVIYHGPYYSDFNNRYNSMCSFVDKFMLRAYRKNNTPFIVKSKLAQKFLQDKNINNITVAGVGVDLGAFEVKENEVVPKEVAKIDEIDGGIKLLYIGRLEKRRNVTFLVDVLKALSDKGIKISLVIVGDGDSEYKDMLFEYIEQSGVKDRICYIEKLEQKYLSLVYNRCHIFLLPTYYEIFGMVLLEAMYFGKLVITTKNGGSDMLISNGKDGIVVDEFDVNKWISAIVFNYGEEEICKNAREKIVNNFTWDAIADKFIDVYKRKVK